MTTVVTVAVYRSVPTFIIRTAFARFIALLCQGRATCGYVIWSFEIDEVMRQVPAKNATARRTFDIGWGAPNDRIVFLHSTKYVLIDHYIMERVGCKWQPRRFLWRRGNLGYSLAGVALAT